MAYTLSDLNTFCQYNGWTDASTGGSTQLDSFINKIIQRLASMREWPFYRKTAWVNMSAPYETGTVALTNADETVTGTGTSFADAMAGQEFYSSFDSDRLYEVSSITDTTNLELTAKYIGTTGSGKTYEIRYVRYDLPSDFDHPAGSLYDQAGSELSCDHVSLGEWHQLRLQGPNTASIPTHVCFDAGGPGQASTYQFRVHPAPSGARALRLPYQALPVTATASVAPDWPEKYLYLLHMLLRIEISTRAPNVGFPILLPEFERQVERAYQRSVQNRQPYEIRPGGGGKGAIEWAHEIQSRFTVSG